MNYKYIFSDMDGTLLNSQGLISKKNVDALNRFMEMGGFFSLATGRSEIITKPFLKYVRPNYPSILFNGAAVYDFDRDIFLFRQILPASSVQEIIRTALSIYPRVCIEAFSEGPLRLLNRNGLTDHLIAREHQPFYYDTFSPEVPYIKVILYGDHSKLLEIAKRISAFAQDKFTVVFSASYYVEIIPYRCTKGRALQWIMSRNNINKNCVLAVGDYDNDIEMLQKAGLGAAPENALPIVKGAADLVLPDNNHDTIAALLNTVFPQKEEHL